MLRQAAKDFLITTYLVLLCAPTLLAQSDSGTKTTSSLTLGQRLERELGVNDSHEYQLTLDTDQYADVKRGPCVGARSARLVRGPLDCLIDNTSVRLGRLYPIGRVGQPRRQALS